MENIRTNVMQQQQQQRKVNNNCLCCLWFLPCLLLFPPVTPPLPPPSPPPRALSSGCLNETTGYRYDGPRKMRVVLGNMHGNNSQVEVDTSLLHRMLRGSLDSQEEPCLVNRNPRWNAKVGVAESSGCQRFFRYYNHWCFFFLYTQPSLFLMGSDI